MKLFLLYLIIMNVVGFLIMGLDKRKAKRHEWRVPEKTLFLCSLLGGCLGTWLGMYAFRHKTQHWYFVVGMPAIFAVWVCGLIWLGIRFPELLSGL